MSRDPANPDKRGPGRRVGQDEKLDVIVYRIGSEILQDKTRRPLLGHGRGSAFARLIQEDPAAGNAKDALLGSIRKYSSPLLRDWEKQHPGE